MGSERHRQSRHPLSEVRCRATNRILNDSLRVAGAQDIMARSGIVRIIRAALRFQVTALASPPVPPSWRWVTVGRGKRVTVEC